MKKHQIMEGQNLRPEGKHAKAGWKNYLSHVQTDYIQTQTMKTHHHNQDHTHVHVYLIYPENKARHNFPG